MMKHCQLTCKDKQNNVENDLKFSTFQVRSFISFFDEEVSIDELRWER